MNRSTIVQKLSELGYKGAKETYDRQCEDTGMQSLSFDERLFELLDAQELFEEKQAYCYEPQALQDQEQECLYK